MATHTCATWGAAETSCSRGRHGAGVSRQSRPVHRPRRAPVSCCALSVETQAPSDSAVRRLAPDGCSFSEDFVVRCYEVGPDRTATIVTVANLLQETAANHAQALWGRGSWTPSLMQEQKLAFALSKMSIRMGSAVQWNDRVRVSTWFAEAGTLAARRDWVIADAATGQQLGAATSTWLAFNLETRRMARLPPTLRTYFDTASPSPPRHALGEHYSPEKLAELLPDAPCYVSSKTRVRRCDLDMNLHVNNASYLAWIMDDVPDAVFATARLTGVDIEYRAECVFGDNLESRATLVNADGSCVLPGDADPLGGQPLGFRHSLVRASDGVEILRARTSWEPLAGGAGHNGHNGRSR